MTDTKTILLVEDDPSIADGQEQTLRKHGYEVIAADTGEKAIEKMRSTPGIDLILMDIDLGKGMDGAEAAQIILREKDVPILFLLSSTRPEEAKKAERVASYGYVIKELGETVLNASIKTAFKLHEIYRALEEREEEYRLLFESASSGIFIAQDNMLKTVNQALARISGYSVEDLTNRPFISFIHPDDVDMIMERYTRRLRGETVESNYAFRIVAADGAARWVEITSVPTSWKGRSATLNYMIDITERKLAQEALKASEEKYRQIFEGATEGIYQITPEGRYLSMNPAFARMFGYTSPQEMIGSVTNIGQQIYVDPKDQERMVRMLREQNKAEGFEVEVYHKDGSRFWISINIHTVRDQAGNTLYFEGTNMDITERKKAENELREREALLNTYLDNAPDGIYLSDTRGNFLYANRKCEEIVGYSRDELKGRNFLDLNLLSAKSLNKAIALLRANVESRSTGPVEIELVSREGRLIPVEIKTTVVQRTDQGIVLAFVRDITDRKRAEEEILGERSKLKTLSDNAPFGMALIDKKGHFTYINRRFTELFGYDIYDIPDGRTWLRRAYPEVEYRHTVVSAWKEDVKNAGPGERKSRVFNTTCKNGIQRIMQSIFSILASGDYLLTYEDITELRQLENQLRQAQKTEAIGTLAGGIAHDFNNILTALMGYAALIQLKMDASDPLRSFVDQILIASQKAADLTQSLLTFSRQRSVTLAPLDMNHTIRVAEKLLRRLLTEDIELHASFVDEDATVMADKSQVDQILFNLVTNARDSMPKGGTLAIETSTTIMNDTFLKTHGFGRVGKYVKITISDTGMGMDETTREKIFDPFFTTKEVGKGTGLGLATVYGIVKQHNGYITVESILNQGTSFHIYLPAVQVKVNETRDTVTPIEKGKETILIAEDNDEVRRFMREALQGHGYSIIEAADGEDAVETFKRCRDIDLVIIDSVMPKKNGRETYEEIRAMDPHVRALFTSGHTRDIILDRGIEEKGFDFIAKPLSLDRLLQKVREVLDSEDESPQPR